jgi:hypothetical protein
MTSQRRKDFYAFGGLTFSVRAAPAIADALQGRFRLLACPPSDSCDFRFDFEIVAGPEEHKIDRPPGKIRPFYETFRGEALYATSEDQLYMNCGESVRVVCNPREGDVLVSIAQPEDQNLWLASHAFFTMPWLELLRRRGFYSLHAAGFRMNGKALLFPGSSGSGKSTLSIALLRAGMEFLGDDTLFLTRTDSDLRVLGFSDEIDVTEETVGLFPELGHLLESSLHPGWPKRPIRSEEVYLQVPLQECSPGVLIFPRVAQVEDSVLCSITKEEAFMELAPNVMLTEIATCKAHFDVLSELVKKSPCYRMETGRDFAAIPKLLEDCCS